MIPAPPDVPPQLLQALTEPFALLIGVWIVCAAALTTCPDAMRRYRLMIGYGLALAMAVGLASLALARPFLTTGQALISSLWPFGAGLALALAGVCGMVFRRIGGTSR